MGRKRRRTRLGICHDQHRVERIWWRKLSPSGKGRGLSRGAFSATGFELIYGHKSANAPRYDLSLVAVKLLTSSRSIAKLAPADANARAGNAFANLKGGAIFWAALALVVIVLLVVVAKLLPKPPTN